MSRIDYFRFAFTYDTSLPTSVETKQLLCDRFDFDAAKYTDDDGGLKRSSLLTKKGMMVIFEGWGSKCDQFLINEGWLADNLQKLSFLRLDIRQELVSDADFNLYRAAIDPNTRKNVQNFNSRVRVKEGDRDAGGTGFSLGSHKSDNRVIVYKRGNEQPAIELMLRTRKLDLARAKAISACREHTKPGQSFAKQLACYDAIKTELDAALDTTTKQIFNCTLGQFVQAELALDGKRTQALAASIQAQLDLIARYGQQELFEGLVEENFG